jgi:cytochrome c5
MTYKLTKSTSILRKSDNACIPADPANRDYQEYLQWVAQGNTPEPVDAPTFAELVAANTAAVQAELDRQAQVKGYDNIVSACSYAAQAVGAPFQTEGAAFLKWRSDVWKHAYDTLAEVQAGTKPMPTPEEAVAQMPALVLP